MRIVVVIYPVPAQSVFYVDHSFLFFLLRGYVVQFQSRLI